ncbi:MAG: Nif3-like dinuclear metal center hexameric protein [Burkholderiales bacterium]|nr:Nif3-like dinuclear metal center hexameric protein [Burkholderiales bacterium]
MLLHELEKYTGQLLQIDRFKDYAPNGVQIEGRATITRIVCGVSASEALIDAAIEQHADAILVHHGYFWRGEDPRLVGAKRRRIAKLLAHNISLLAYHLPLDAHPTLGNNAQLGLRLGLEAEGRFGEQELGWSGHLAAEMPLSALGQHIAAQLGREPLLLGDPAKTIRRVGWCTGGAQGYFPDAIAAGCDAYLTGEVSEQHYHMAMESGVAFIAAGHHATERYGVQALAAHLAEHFGLTQHYVDLPNPV